MTEAQIRALTAARRGDEGPLLLVLQDIQHEFGYIDPSWVVYVADELNLSRAEVYGVITFYADLRTTPPGRTHIKICRAEACQSVGGHALAAHARDRLGIDFGETTPDGSVTLDQVFCLGNCALGPAIQVDDKMVGRIDDARFDAIVADVTKEPAR
jgi:formate dehydrogenase subunit gamma